MTELPPAQAANLGLGPRKFRVRDGPDMSDRSCWTDTPAQKAQKQIDSVSALCVCWRFSTVDMPYPGKDCIGIQKVGTSKFGFFGPTHVHLQHVTFIYSQFR